MKELTNRLLFLLFAIVIYRLGVHIPVPGVSADQLNIIFADSDGTFVGLFNLFSGGGLARMSVFSLGIVPYISASIITQLAQAIIPSLHQLRRQGDKGRAKLSSYIRWLTLLLAFVQSLGLSFAMRSQDVFISDSWILLVSSVMTITAGCMYLMWLGEQITERGVGNGMSMLIFVSIVSRLPVNVAVAFEQAREGVVDIFSLLLLVLMLLGVVVAIISIERAQRRIPLTYANRQAMQQQGAGGFSHFPLKINMTGVIPAIFASSLLLLPYSLATWLGDGSNSFLQNIALALSPNQPLYLVLFVAAIYFFGFFYTSLVFNPMEISDNLKRSNAFVPGIRPGKPTADFFDRVVTRLTLVGATYIAVIALLPQLFSAALSMNFLFAGTSVLIMIVVAMDFIAQVQSLLFSSQYSSMLNKTNLRNYGR